MTAIDGQTSNTRVATPRPSPRRSSLPRTTIARYIILSIFAIAFVVPLYVMVSASLKTTQDAGIEKMWQLPIPIDLKGVATAWQRLSPNLLNSFLVVIPATVLTSLVGALNGYLLSKVRFPFSNALFVLVIFGMYIPFQAVLIPLVQFLQGLHLYGQLLGLTLTHAIYGLTISTLIFRNYYVWIPNDLVEAAALDGAGILQTFFRVFLPISIPGFVVCGIFQFTNQWNDFLLALVVVPSPSSQPVTVALNNLSGSTSVDWNIVMAGAVLAAIPTVIAYVVAGRYFIRGLTAGSYR
jgi:glucose/mannose transport system permease protein